ncbi:MAG: response regulator transcription factor [Bdellovibrionaceae bacterium]|nr:response regulator transcription factor [Pseudobdellovibrionaceae bacterium]
MSSLATRILVVDDHPIFREGLKLSLDSSLKDFTWVGEAANAKTALDQIYDKRPDLVILDLILGSTSGLDVVREVKSRQIPTKILVLTQVQDPKTERELRRLEVDAILSKMAPLQSVVEAVEALRNNQPFTSPPLPNSNEEEGMNPVPALKPNLTAREVEIVRLVAAGQTQKEIAETLGCAPETVKTHKGNLLRKLGARNSAEIVAWATRTGLI